MTELDNIRIRIKTLQEKYRRLPKDRKLYAWLFAAMVFLLSLLVIAVPVGMSIRKGKTLYGETLHGAVYYGLTGGGLALTLFLYAAVVLLDISWRSRRRKLNTAEYRDENGVEYARDKTFGSAHFMSAQEAEKEYTVCDVSKTHLTMYGQLTEHGEKAVAMPDPEHSSDLRNTLIIGLPGTGKSRGFVTSEIINAIYRGESIVVSDPSGELYAQTNWWLRNFKKPDGSTGVKVKLLNFIDPEYSDSWDCLKETVSEKTGRLDETKLNKFVKILLDNVREDALHKGDPFWDNMSQVILKGTIGYVAWKHENTVMMQLKRLFEKVCSRSEVGNGFSYSSYRTLFTGLNDLTICRKIILEGAAVNGYDTDEVQRIMDQIDASAPPYTIAEVVDCLPRFGTEIKTAYETAGAIPDEQPGKKAYLATQQPDLERVISSGIIGTIASLQVFSDSKLKYNLSHPGIDILNITKEQTVMFVGMSDRTPEMKPVCSIFFSFMFDDLIGSWDTESQKAREKGQECPLLDLTVILDEFTSLGVIGSSAMQFTTYMSDARKRHFAISLIVQSIGQIDSVYGKDNAATIRGDCNTKLYLGTADPETMKYISDLCGKTTVIREMHPESNSLVGILSPVRNVSPAQAALINPDAVGNLQDILLIRFRKFPLKLKMLSYTELPDYKAGKLKIQSVQSTMPSFESRANREYESKSSVSAISDAISSLEPCMIYACGMAEQKYLDEADNERIRYLINRTNKTVQNSGFGDRERRKQDRQTGEEERTGKEDDLVGINIIPQHKQRRGRKKKNTEQEADEAGSSNSMMD